MADDDPAAAPPDDPAAAPQTPHTPETPPEPAAPADGPAEPAAPEGYTFQAPDGVELDAGMVERFAPLAREMGLSQDQAQQLVDLYTGGLQAQAAQAAAAEEARAEAWEAEARRDPEIGGAGFEAALGTARQGLERFATPALRTLMDETGMGSHPEVVRLFYRIGRAVAEDAPVTAGTGGGRRDLADVLYGSNAKE